LGSIDKIFLDLLSISQNVILCSFWRSYMWYSLWFYHFISCRKQILKEVEW